MQQLKFKNKIYKWADAIFMRKINRLDFQKYKIKNSPINELGGRISVYVEKVIKSKDY